MGEEREFQKIKWKRMTFCVILVLTVTAVLFSALVQSYSKGNNIFIGGGKGISLPLQKLMIKLH